MYVQHVSKNMTKFRLVKSQSSDGSTLQCNAIAALDDTPPTVITFNDIDIVVYERIGATASFDTICVYKNFTQSVLSITNIPIHQLRIVKAFFVNANIPAYEIQYSLNWKSIMELVTSDLGEFIRQVCR